MSKTQYAEYIEIDLSGDRQQEILKAQSLLMVRLETRRQVEQAKSGRLLFIDNFYIVDRVENEKRRVEIGCDFKQEGVDTGFVDGDTGKYETFWNLRRLRAIPILRDLLTRVGRDARTNYVMCPQCGIVHNAERVYDSPVDRHHNLY